MLPPHRALGSAHGGKLDHWAIVLASVCTALAMLISSCTVAAHMVQTRRRQLRNTTLRILMMVPLYALASLLALLVKDWALVLGVVRSTYEAFALFSFVQLMLAYLSLHAPADGDGARGAAWLALDLRTDPPTKHLPPLCWLQPWPPGPVFLRRTLVGVFQYTAIMPLVTLVSCITWASGVYGDGEALAWDRAFPYLSLVQNCSQMWALYCLVLFYRATSSRLQQIRPLGKFLCIKLVVFATWWQDVSIAMLVQLGVIEADKLENPDADGYLSTDEVAVALNSLIVCVEMVFFAIAHVHTFPPSDYAVEHEIGATKYSLQHSGEIEDTLLDHNALDDPETNPWDARVRLPRVRTRDTIRDFVRGVNVFDVLLDVRGMFSLRTSDAAESVPGRTGPGSGRPGGSGGGAARGFYESPSLPAGESPTADSASFFFDSSNEPTAYLDAQAQPDIF